VTVSQAPSGKYYASIQFEYEQEIESVKPEVFPGLDFSMRELFVSSEGKYAEYPRYYRPSLQRLKKAQRKMSICQKGCRNQKKLRIKVAGLHEKVSS
jgi:transposase